MKRSARASRCSPRSAGKRIRRADAQRQCGARRGHNMYVTVNGARLYFDVEGAGLVPDGPRMREKPTLLLLHGGPGFDHTTYKPAFSSTRRHRAGGLSRSSRQRPQQRRSRYMDARAVGRRRKRLLRCTRHREADRLWRVVRRIRCAILRDASSRPSRQADPRQHCGAHGIRDSIRRVRANLADKRRARLPSRIFPTRLRKAAGAFSRHAFRSIACGRRSTRMRESASRSGTRSRSALAVHETDGAAWTFAPISRACAARFSSSTATAIPLPRRNSTKRSPDASRRIL